MTYGGVATTGPIVDMFFDNVLTPMMAMMQPVEQLIEDWVTVQRLWLLI